MDPEKLRRTLQEKGLIQNGLFVCGAVDGKNYPWGFIADLVLLPVTIHFGMLLTHFTLSDYRRYIEPTLVGITLVDGELVIAPSNDEEILTDKIVRIKREDVKDVRLINRLDMYLIITPKEGEVFKCRILRHAKTIQKMIDLFNSQ